MRSLFLMFGHFLLGLVFTSIGFYMVLEKSVGGIVILAVGCVHLFTAVVSVQKHWGESY